MAAEAVNVGLIEMLARGLDGEPVTVHRPGGRDSVAAGVQPTLGLQRRALASGIWSAAGCAGCDEPSRRL